MPFAQSYSSQFRQTEKVSIAGETIELLPERALFWASRQTLVIADPRWDSNRNFEDDLDRLTQALERTEAKRLILLGDLGHIPHELNHPTNELIAAWRDSFAGDVIAVRGGNERHEFPESWNFTSVSQKHYDPPFVFSNLAQPDGSGYAFAGHVHPVIHMRADSNHIRLPCFWFDDSHAILPSFAGSAGGGEVFCTPTAQVFGIAEDSVVRVS